MPSEDLPTAEEILVTHDEIEDQYDLKHTGAHSSVPQVGLRELLDEAENQDGVYRRAAFLLRKLITEHIFKDGNKRTAWITTRSYLESNGLQPAETGDRVPKVLRRIRRFEIDEIARRLESGEIDEDRLRP